MSSQKADGTGASSHRPEKLTVMILGAGPAGLALANILAQADLGLPGEILLIDKRDADEVLQGQMVCFTREGMRSCQDFLVADLYDALIEICKVNFNHSDFRIANNTTMKPAMLIGTSSRQMGNLQPMTIIPRPELRKLLIKNLGMIKQVNPIRRLKATIVGYEARCEPAQALRTYALQTVETFDQELTGHFIFDCSGVKSIISQAILGNRMSIKEAWLIGGGMVSKHLHATLPASLEDGHMYTAWPNGMRLYVSPTRMPGDQIFSRIFWTVQIPFKDVPERLRYWEGSNAQINYAAEIHDEVLKYLEQFSMKVADNVQIQNILKIHDANSGSPFLHRAAGSYPIKKAWAENSPPQIILLGDALAKVGPANGRGLNGAFGDALRASKHFIPLCKELARDERVCTKKQAEQLIQSRVRDMKEALIIEANERIFLDHASPDGAPWETWSGPWGNWLYWTLMRLVGIAGSVLPSFGFGWLVGKDSGAFVADRKIEALPARSEKAAAGTSHYGYLV